MKIKKLASVFLAVVMMVGVLAACGSGASSGGGSTGTGGAEEPAGADSTAGTDDGTSTSDRELITLEVFDVAANYQGIQGGWFGKVVEDKFGLILNIFAPNVSGDGQALYQTRSSSGQLGDLIMLDNPEFLDCIKAGLIRDITDEIDSYPNLAGFREQVDILNSQFVDDGKIYGIPADMTNTSPTTYSESNPLSAPCLPWDYYKELGFPEMKNLDDLLDVLEQIQTAHPTNDAGDPAYAVSLWKDWDGFGMENVRQTAKWYGQEVQDSVLVGNDNSLMPLTDENGGYYKMLRFFYEANKRGLVDPDSGVQNWTTADETKLRAYRTYLLWYNWSMNLSSVGLTQEDRDAGKGFVNIPLDDLNIFQTADSYYGLNRTWGVGAHLDDETAARVLEFIDWMGSPEGAVYMWTGIEGVNYTVREDGKFVATDDSFEYVANNKEVPEEWGGGGFADGNCKLNQYVLNSMAVNPNTGDPYSFGYWTSEQERDRDLRFEEWTEKYGTRSSGQYFEENGMMTMVPNVVVIGSGDSTDIALIRSQCGTEITNASWKMVFATSDEEFDQMWESMKTNLEGLGWAELLEADMEKCQKLVDLRAEAIS